VFSRRVFLGVACLFCSVVFFLPPIFFDHISSGWGLVGLTVFTAATSFFAAVFRLICVLFVAPRSCLGRVVQAFSLFCCMSYIFYVGICSRRFYVFRWWPCSFFLFWGCLSGVSVLSLVFALYGFVTGAHLDTFSYLSRPWLCSFCLGSGWIFTGWILVSDLGSTLCFSRVTWFFWVVLSFYSLVFICLALFLWLRPELQFLVPPWAALLFDFRFAVFVFWR